MLAGPLVFVDIDTQRDFLEPTGALYVPGSEAILPQLGRLTEFARETRIPILATACAHVPEDPELATFGPHCMLGTPGQERVHATAWPGSVILGRGGLSLDAASSLSPKPPHATIRKAQIDFFGQPDADRLIDWYCQNGPTFVVYGVATDYCVRANAMGLLRRECRVAVVVDAI